MLWIGTTIVFAVLGGRVLRRRDDSSFGEVLSTFITNSTRVLVFALAVFAGSGVFVMAAKQDTALGHASAWCIVLVASAAAWVIGMFLVRQLLAPPWWRLNAWDARRTSDFGVLPAVRWIFSDIRDLIGSLRPIDRFVALIGVPLAAGNAMLLLGPATALILIYVALFTSYLALVFALFSANRIPRALITRLQDLRHVAHRIAGGDLSARVGYTIDHEYEELGQLVADINSMARSLESREHENRALNLELQKTLKVEQERASTDQLTGLRNHRYFQEALAAELYRCTRTGETTTIAIIDLDDFKAVNDAFGHQEGDAVLKRAARAFEDTLRPYDLPARLGGEEFGVIFPSTSPEEAKMVMDRIMDALVTSGPNKTSLTFSGGIASFPLHAKDQSTLYQLADSSSYAAKLNGKKHTVVFEPGRVQALDESSRVNTRERDAQIRAAKTLVATVDAVEGFGNEHSENVGVISQKIAGAMGYDDSFAQQMYLTGLLHDVGKLGLDQAIVQKSGQLTAAEFEQVKRHPELSAQIVKNAGLIEIATWVRHHHEHFDGSGYPMRLAGQDIPIGSRIILVAEAFDVMTSTRSYRQAMSLADAVAELVREAGTRFDPSVVQALYALVQAGEVVASDYHATLPASNENAAPLSLPKFDAA
jgi:diguanylate cyclase (GGDEF)-like protein